MNKIKVKAAQGLRVPMADNPHQYIEQEAMEVADNVYYRRLIHDGDLILMPSEKIKAEKGKANG